MKDVIIVDLDGTIADITHREKYITGDKPDWKKFFNACHKDKPIQEVIEVVKALSNNGNNLIVFVTGRSETVRDKTRLWLRNELELDESLFRLFMRPKDNYSPDYILKKEILNKYIGKERVLCVLEDRNNVVKMWRDEGLVCLQVANGDF